MRKRWPARAPFEDGLLAVSKLHSIHYSLYGNPEGAPVFFLHGGPGCGCDDEDATWFDPDRFLVVTHDQRGCGRSTPWAEIENNTPHDLVGDIAKLRAHLGIVQPVLLFAGSWGTTLALLFAQAHPEQVREMILRGVYTCGWEDQDYFYAEKGGGSFSPEAYERFVQSLPPGEGRIQERLHRLFEESDQEGKRKWFWVLAAYEYSFFGVSADELDQDADAFRAHFAEMRINCHYQANRFFLEDEQILTSIDRIQQIPTTIVHGARDVICPPRVAWRLHRHLPGSKLVLLDGAGHLSSEPRIEQALLDAVADFAARA